MFLTIITFILVLTFLVFVHELGHFYTARKTGTKVEEFGLGLPPRLLGLRRRSKAQGRGWEWVGAKVKSQETDETIYSLNWLPIGGFVKIKGENEDDPGPESFSSKTIAQRALMLSAGVLMNFISAVVLLAVALNIGFPTTLTDDLDPARVKDRAVQITSVLDDSPAAQARLQAGDLLVALDELAPGNIDQVQRHVSQNQDREIAVTVRRNQELITAGLTPVLLSSSEAPILGVGLVETGTVSYPWPTALWRGVTGTGYVTLEIFKVIGRMIGGLATGEGFEGEIAGPVGIAVMTGQFVDLGLVFVLQFAALLSINLGIINILPFPALDGGRLLFILIEKFRGRAVSKKIENIAHTIGFALLIGLIIFVTFNDFSRFGDQIFGAVKGIF